MSGVRFSVSWLGRGWVRVVAAVVALALVTLGTLVASEPRVTRSRSTTASRPAAPARVGELPERRTATSTTQRNRNGSMTTTVYGSPVNYRAPDGSWQPIDTRLYPVAGGEAGAGYAWRSGGNVFQARFASSSEADYAEVRLGGRVLRMGALGAAGRPGVVSGSQVSYPGAFAGVDLRYQVTATGIKETLDLSGPQAPARYTFRLSVADGGAGLTAQRRPDGSVAVSAAPLDGAALVLAAPVVTESAPDRQVAPPEPAARPDLQVARDGRDLLVTLSVDASWLSAPGRRFPVHLDPTMTIQPDVEDASFVTLTNYAPYVGDRLFIGSDTNNWRAALRFDLGALPSDAQVTAASLGLYYDGWCIAVSGVPFCGGTSHPMEAHRLTSAWTTSTTFDRLTMDSTVAGTFTLPSSLPQGWMTFPMTSLVTGWVAGTTPNYGLIVKRQTEVTNSSGPVPPGLRFTGAPTLQPKLDITYTSDAVDLLEPATLHSNGAELAWTQYTGPSGAPFDRYEVHRASGTANFTPGPDTLVATIRDRSITTYRDTTASPSKTFTYRIVANTSASNPRTVSLPGPGLASKTLQPGPADGRDTYLYYSTQITNCANYGADTAAWVGSSSNARWRDVLSFDLRDIPAGASISSASLSLYREYGANNAMTIEAHRITRAWQEGTGLTQCTGGATWYEGQSGTNWTTQGGDYDGTIAGSVNVTSGTSGLFDNFTITGLVQSWVNGSTPNYGVLLRAASESLVDGNSIVYATDDYTASSTLRPKLAVSYSDGSVALAPTVSVAAPGAGATVSGSSVALAAAAADDGRVGQVEFLVDGAVVGSAPATPYQTSWNSASVTNGAHTLTARATDDAGNVTTSAGVSVTVDNTAPPTGTVSAPSTGSGTVTLSATASDDVGVASVAFLIDGVRVGAPVTTAPYTVGWNTLDPLAPGFNGSHQVTAAITDTSGQVYVTPAVSTSVNNLAGNAWGMHYTLNNPNDTTDDVFPPAMAANSDPSAPVQDPYAGTTRPDGTSGGSLNRALADAPQDNGTPSGGACPANAYCPTVNVVNASGSAWNNSPVQVWYRWYAPNGAIMFEGRSSTSFPSSFGKNASQAFPLTIYPPALPPGATEGSFRLRVDLYDPVSGTWFAARGVSPIDNPIIIAKVLATKLGLERYYQYDGASVGAGMSNLVNVANGDLLLRWSPFFSPGRGLATMTDLTYNSLEDHSKSPAGNNFSLSMSGLIRLGEPIDIHPNKADLISGRSNKWVEFTDGDGSVHHFDGVTGADGITRWTEPPGVNLYLRSLGGSDLTRQWALTRPDNVTYYFDDAGFPTSVQDRNGNRITYTLENTPAGEDPGGPAKRITAVTDAGGRSFAVHYWSKAEAKKAHVRGKIKEIVDHSGSVLRFDYYDDGNLLRLTQVGGTNADGTFLADRSFTFTYTTSNGAGPAIGSDDATGTAARLNPDPKTANQSTRLYSVIDPRQHETRYAYYLPSDPGGAQLRWKLKSRTDRDGQATGYGYDLTNQITTVTAPLNRVTRYTYDTSGKVVSILNAKNETTGVQWTPDFKVSQVTEPTGKFSSYTYNANGYPLTQSNELQQTTTLTYFDSAVDVNDTGKHLSLLATVTTPKGTASPTAGDYQTRYTYDSAGNVDKVTDPAGGVTDYDYNLAGSANPGTLAAVHDANGNPATTYPAYDPSGQATQMRDPLGNLTQFGYDVDGNLSWLQDPNHASNTGTDTRSYRDYFDYDSFGRLGRQSAPKSTSAEPGTVLWSSVAFDANDNTVRSMDAHYGTTGSDPGGGPVTSTAFDSMDRATLITGPDTSADPAGERTQVSYDAAGRTRSVTKPRGVLTTGVTNDFTTIYAYDPLDRVTSTTQYGTDTSAGQTRLTQYCYDTAGDLRSVTAPRAGLTTVTCPGNGPSTASFTTKLDYDPAHRRTARRDPLGHEQRTSYDDNGNAIVVETDITTGRVQRTETDYDQADRPITIRERFDGATGRNATTRIEYDANGNRSRVISPRGSDAGGAGPYTYYVQVYSYDAVNQLIRTQLPFDGRDGTERQYVHRSYDANGNLASVSLPVTQSDPALVGSGAKTTTTHFDPGWVRVSDDPDNPAVHYDYTAQGQQSLRTPEVKGSPGTLDTAKQMTWTYYPDKLLKSRKDQGGQPSTYGYDADNNLISLDSTSGVTDPSEHQVLTRSTFTGFDEVAKTRHQKQGDSVWTFTDYTYDADGNVTVRRENGEEDSSGTQTKSPHRYELTYDGADWLSQQLDLGTDSTCAGDSRTVTTWWSSGWEKQRDTYRAGSTCTSDPTTWPKKESTAWTHYDNGKLRTLTTTNGSGTVTASHQVGYVDANNIYVDGNRTTDHYTLTRGTGSTATTCVSSSPCDAAWSYDARDRVIHEQQRAGKTIDYTLDQPADLLGDTSVRAGNVTTKLDNGTTTTQRYTGNQLTDVTVGGATAKYWYDDQGNTDCVTTSAGSQANCSPSGTPSSNLLIDNSYDYLNRLTSERQYSAGTQTDKSSYVYDALDRTTKETEDHAGTGNDRTTNFTYQGLTNLVTQEAQTGGTSPQTKTYSYDNYGHRLGMSDKDNATGTTNNYTYGMDVHGSVSQLIDDAGNVKASYGYTAYGGTDAPASDSQSLTSGDTNSQAPLNPYRFSGRRADSGTANSTTAQPAYDMGARRYGPSTGRFQQTDVLYSALADLGLALDPLTQNRYALAGGNPISYVEIDGHMLIADGGGGGSTSPNPTSTQPSSSGWIGSVKTVARNAWDDIRDKAAFHAADFINDGIVGGLADWHVSILKQQAKESMIEANQLVGHYLKTPGGTEHSRWLNQEAFNKFMESDRYSLKAASVERSIGSKIPVVGLAVTAASIGWDIHQGKPAGKAVVSGVGGALAAAGTGALIGTAIGGPIGTVVGAAAGVVVGAVASGALDWAYDQLPQGVQDSIDGGFKAVGDAASDVGGAIADGAKNVWDSLF